LNDIVIQNNNIILMQNYGSHYPYSSILSWNENIQYANAQLEIQNATLARMIDTLVYNNNMYREQLRLYTFRPTTNMNSRNSVNYSLPMANSYMYQSRYPPAPIYQQNYDEYSLWNGTNNPLHILRKKTNMDMLYDSMNTFDTSYRI